MRRNPVAGSSSFLTFDSSRTQFISIVKVHFCWFFISIIPNHHKLFELLNLLFYQPKKVNTELTVYLVIELSLIQLNISKCHNFIIKPDISQKKFSNFLFLVYFYIVRMRKYIANAISWITIYTIMIWIRQSRRNRLTMM